MFISLKKAVEITGLHPNTLRKYADDGTIKHYRKPNGDRMFDVESFIGSSKDATICYARVSTNKQKNDLDNQTKWLSEQYPKAEIIKDVGSGLNFKRKGLRTILERSMSGERITLVISYRDRLVRFGFELIEWIIERNGGKIMVLNKLETSPIDELTKDIMAIITVFSARLHGLRLYKNKIKVNLT